MGLNTNTKKTVSMTCRPCIAAGNRSEEAYGRFMMGEGLTFRERKIERVEYGDCRKEVAAGSLDSHRMSQNGKARERRWAWTDAATGGEKGESILPLETPLPPLGELYPICLMLSLFSPPVAASVHAQRLSLAFPCWDMWCESSDPAATSFPLE